MAEAIWPYKTGGTKPAPATVGGVAQAPSPVGGGGATLFGGLADMAKIAAGIYEIQARADERQYARALREQLMQKRDVDTAEAEWKRFFEGTTGQKQSPEGEQGFRRTRQIFETPRETFMAPQGSPTLETRPLQQEPKPAPQVPEVGEVSPSGLNVPNLVRQPESKGTALAKTAQADEAAMRAEAERVRQAQPPGPAREQVGAQLRGPQVPMPSSVPEMVGKQAKVGQEVTTQARGDMEFGQKRESQKFLDIYRFGLRDEKTGQVIVQPGDERYLHQAVAADVGGADKIAGMNNARLTAAGQHLVRLDELRKELAIYYKSGDEASRLAMDRLIPKLNDAEILYAKMLRGPFGSDDPMVEVYSSPARPHWFTGLPSARRDASVSIPLSRAERYVKGQMNMTDPDDVMDTAAIHLGIKPDAKGMIPADQAEVLKKYIPAIAGDIATTTYVQDFIDTLTAGRAESQLAAAAPPPQAPSATTNVPAGQRLAEAKESIVESLPKPAYQEPDWAREARERGRAMGTPQGPQQGAIQNVPSKGRATEPDYSGTYQIPPAGLQAPPQQAAPRAAPPGRATEPDYSGTYQVPPRSLGPQVGAGTPPAVANVPPPSPHTGPTAVIAPSQGTGGYPARPMRFMGGKLTKGYLDGEAKYGPIADRVADQNGIPRQILRNVLANESSWNPMNVGDKEIKPTGAHGLGQQLVQTLETYGMRMRGKPFTPEEVRANPELSIEIAGRHLADNLRAFKGNVPLAVGYYKGGTEALSGLWSKGTDDYVYNITGRYLSDDDLRAGYQGAGMKFVKRFQGRGY